MARKVLIVLAAGASARMGTPKALLPARGGRTFLGQIAHRARMAGLDVLVVTGAHAKEIALAHPELTQLVNRGWRSGQWSSVKTGLKAVRGRVLIQPVDAPNVSARTFAKLAAVRARAAFVAYRGEPGHPVMVDAAACLRARAKTLAEALNALGAVAVATRDRHVLDNINSPRDLGNGDRPHFFSSAAARAPGRGSAEAYRAARAARAARASARTPATPGRRAESLRPRCASGRTRSQSPGRR